MTKYLFIFFLFISFLIYSDDIESLFKAVDNKDSKTIERLIKKISVNQRYNYQGYGEWTAFLWASMKGNQKIIDIMIKNRANIDDLVINGNYDGWNALMIAGYHGNKDIVSILLKKGINIKYKTSNNENPLHIVCKSDKISLDILKLLIDKGISINETDNDGYTPLINLSGSENPDSKIIELLLNKKADINHKNSNGVNSLMIACVNQSDNTTDIIKSVKLLVERKIDINAKDNYGYNVLMSIASTYYNNDKDLPVTFAEILIKNGININDVNNSNETALTISKRNKKDALTELLIKNGAK